MEKGHRVEVLVETDFLNKIYYVEDHFFTNVTAYRQAMVNILQLYEDAENNGYKIMVREKINSVNNELEENNRRLK